MGKKAKKPKKKIMMNTALKKAYHTGGPKPKKKSAVRKSAVWQQPKKDWKIFKADEE